MKVYIVYYIPDYIGIEIIKIFKDEKKAKQYVEEHNKANPGNTEWEYAEEEIE